MSESEVLKEIERLRAEQERIERTFPPDSARILIRDIDHRLSKLYEQICPF